MMKSMVDQEQKDQWSKEARSRKRILRFLLRSIKDLGLDPRQVCAAAGMRPNKLNQMKKVRPQLRILCPIGAVIQEAARAQHKEDWT